MVLIKIITNALATAAIVAKKVCFYAKFIDDIN